MGRGAGRHSDARLTRRVIGRGPWAGQAARHALGGCAPCAAWGAALPGHSAAPRVMTVPGPIDHRRAMVGQDSQRVAESCTIREAKRSSAFLAVGDVCVLLR